MSLIQLKNAIKATTKITKENTPQPKQVNNNNNNNKNKTQKSKITRKTN